MEMTVLGSGAAFARDALNAGYVLDRRLLVDAGAPAHVSLARTGHDVGQLEAAIMTHRHADHTFGLPFVMATRAVYHRNAPPFTVVGPPGFAEYISKLMELAWGKTLHRIVWERLQLTMTEIKPGQTIEVAGFDVHAEEVVHVRDQTCVGYAFARNGVRFGFSGDCGDCDGLVRLIDRCDDFLIEMTDLPDDPGHLDRKTVAAYAARFPDKRFYATHLNNRQPLPGVELMQDLQTIELRPRQATQA